MESLKETLKTPNFINGLRLKEIISDFKNEVKENHDRLIKLKKGGSYNKSRKYNKKRKNSSMKNK